MDSDQRALVLGATGAVGSSVVRTLCASPRVTRITTLGRRPVDTATLERTEGRLVQLVVDALDPKSYEASLGGHDLAFCTLGVGQPSKTSKEEFRRVDYEAPLAFARACRAASVRHFSLLASVGASTSSASSYLKSKAELEEAIGALDFERTSIFRPSMLMTDENRYGWVQGLSLAVFPYLDTLLLGPLKRFRSIHVSELGRAMVENALADGRGFERLEWSDFQRLLAGATRPSAEAG